MNSQEATDKLTRKGIKPTANRILVYKALLSHSAPMSLGDMETLMPSMDKSSIFRTLTLFLEHDVVHAFEADVAYSTTNCARKRASATIMTDISTSTARRASALSVWTTSIFQVSNCPKDSVLIPFPLSSKANAPNVREKNHPHSIEHNKTKSFTTRVYSS